MSIDTAYILAAGLGTRLRPLTDERPKPLVEVGGIPLIEYALRYAKRADVKRICINTHHLYPAVEQAIGDAYCDVPIVYSYEETVLGTGGGLRTMFDRLGQPTGTALILNADALIDFDIGHMIAEHQTHNALATLATKDTPNKAKFGLLGSDDTGRIFGFAGRTRFTGPFAAEAMFCGVHLVESALFSRLVPTFSCVNTIGYPPAIDADEVVRAFDIGDGYFCDVGTPGRLMEAHEKLLSGTLRYVDGPKTEGGSFVHPSATIHPGVHIGTNVVLGKDVEVGSFARLDDVVVQSGTTIAAATVLKRAIVSPAHTMEVL